VPHSVSLNRRVALYAVTDLLVCSQVRASTHRVPLEYVVTRTKDGSPSTVLMSEFAGSHRILTGAERTNPWHTKHFAAALARCIDMAPAERRARHQLNTERAENFTTTVWAAQVATALKRAHKRVEKMTYVELHAIVYLPLHFTRILLTV